MLGGRIVAESKTLEQLSLALLHYLRPAKRKIYEGDQTSTKRMKPLGTIIQRPIGTGILGEVDANMIDQFPELSSYAQTAKAVNDSGHGFFDGTRRTSPL